MATALMAHAAAGTGRVSLDNLAEAYSYYRSDEFKADMAEVAARK